MHPGRPEVYFLLPPVTKNGSESMGFPTEGSNGEGGITSKAVERKNSAAITTNIFSNIFTFFFFFEETKGNHP